MTSSNTLKKIVSIGAAILMAVGGTALPAQAAVFTITYANLLGSSGSAPAAEQTDSNGQLAVNNGSGLSSNSFTFLGWSTYDFNGFQAGSSPMIYGTSSLADSPTITATANTTLKATWSLAITQLSMSNPTEIPFSLIGGNVVNLDANPPLTSDFTVTVDGSPVNIASITNGKIVLADALTSAQQLVRASYTPVAGRRLMNNMNYVIPGFTNATVVTNSIQFPPTLSAASVSSTTHSSATFAFTSNFNGDLRYVVKASTDTAPASAQDLANGTYGAGVVSSSGSFPGLVNTGARTLNVSGLTASTSYKVWIAGKNNQYNTYSNMIELSFTTSAAPAAPTFTGTVAVGSSVTASTSGQWYYCATAHSSGNLAFDCSPIYGQMGSLLGTTVVIPENSVGMQVVSLAGKHLTVVANSQAAATQLIAAGSGSNNNQNNNSPTVCAGQTGLTNVTLSVSTVTRTGTYRRIFNNDPTLNNCVLPQMALATGTYVNGNLVGTISAYASIGLGAYTADRTLTSIETPLGRQLVAGDVITFKYWSGISNAQTAATSIATFAPTLTIVSADASVDATDVAEPLPVWARNIVASIPTLTKSLVTAGGSVSLTGVDYADLKSVTIGGKAVAFKVETTGNVTIPVTAGEAGKTADIVIVFSGGTMVVQDGIKYVAPLNVAKIGERPIAIAASAKRITAAVADQIRHAAFANMNNNTISCVAYAANNTVKAKAAAKLIAVQACGIASKANPGLKASEITVVVNKTKAKNEAVGIKVYKADI